MKRRLFFCIMMLGVGWLDAMNDPMGYPDEEYAINDDGLRRRSEPSEPMIKQLCFNFSHHQTVGKLVSFNTTIEGMRKGVRDYVDQEYPDLKKFYAICERIKAEHELDGQDYYPVSHIMLVTFEQAVPQEKVVQLLKDLPPYAEITYNQHDESEKMQQRETVKVIALEKGCNDCTII